MKHRILGVLTAFAAAAFPFLPFMQNLPAAAWEDTIVMDADEWVQDSGKEPAALRNDVLSYGEEEAFSIVPCCAGSSSFDLRIKTNEMILYKTHRKANQRWTVHPCGEYVYFQNEQNQNVLSVPEAVSKTTLFTAPCTSADNQLWKLEDAGDGTYFIRSKQNENLVIDVYGSGTEDYTKIWLHDFNGSQAQRFRFVHLTTPEPMSEWGAPRHDCSGSDWSFWDGSWDTDWYYSNRNARTFCISTAEELASIAGLVQNGITSFEGKEIILTRDIHLCGNAWTPIGNARRQFRGSFNGGGHAITGLSITETEDDQGLFGVINGGAVGNFALKGAVAGDERTGGVCGQISGGILYDIYSEVELTIATDDFQGGIAGSTGKDAVIYACYNAGTVHNSDDDYIGGICGDNNSDQVWSCINTGNVHGDTHVGGITGDDLCTGCLNLGHVTGDSRCGAISGDNGSRLEWCRALSYTCSNLNGKGGSANNGAEWISAAEIVSGKCCFDLNHRDGGIDYTAVYGVKEAAVFSRISAVTPIRHLPAQKSRRRGTALQTASMRSVFPRKRITARTDGTAGSFRCIWSILPVNSISGRSAPAVWTVRGRKPKRPLISVRQARWRCMPTRISVAASRSMTSD